ncbi:hypothetical protein [Paludisphaera sp.]|uniref:hypothetical protein n=1 Tax=Paludisphaera sp. TaxID=2017432 RepID=UPI00301C79AE
MIIETARRALAAGLLLAALAPAGRAQEAPVYIPPPATFAGAGGHDDIGAIAPPIVRPEPVVVEPADEVQTTLDRAPLDPVATSRRGPRFVLKKIRSWHWRRVQGKLLGYPEEFKPRPLGTSVYAMGRTMASNGAEARLALYDYDFVAGSAELTDRGRDQLAKAAAQLAASPFPLIVERTPRDPALAGERRRVVIETLAASSLPVDAGRVLVGQPAPFGLSGIDAQIISANALNRTQQYGPPIPINANGVNSPSGVTNQMVGVVPGQ